MKNKLITLAAACMSVAILSMTASAQLQRCTESGSVRSVTKARRGNFETVTFEIVGNTLPDKVEIENAKPPITNYNGDNLHMKGPLFKEVHLNMVAWTCKIRENLGASTMTITGVKQTEQFEGYVSYAIGYTKRSKYVGITKTTGVKTSKVVVKFRR
jgi:hypothetical protein